MAGVYFLIWVPNEEHENYLNDRLGNTRGATNTIILDDDQRSEDTQGTCESDKSDDIKLIPMEKRLLDILEGLDITHAEWSTTSCGKFKLASFCLANGPTSEEALKLLTESGIGHRLDSVVSIIPCSLYYHGNEANLSPTLDIDSVKEQEESTAWQRFLESARPQLFLPQVILNVKKNASFTFDFFLFLIISTLLAATGLIESSQYILVASMILSPMMGPVTAVMFGVMVRDKSLLRMGALNEILGLLVCVIIGFLFGLAVSYIGNLTGNENGWPSHEMVSKGQVASLWAEVVIALLSGAAVAIAILNEHTSSAIGTAISVALLPPAVNAGLLWSLATFNYIFKNELPFFVEYTPLWSRQPYAELAILGGISLCVTVINIICIFISGCFVIKLKEILPKTARGPRKWNQLYQTLDNEEDKLGTPQSDRIQFPRFRNIHNLNVFAGNQYTWSPASSYAHPPVSSIFSNENTFNQFKSSFPRRLTGSLHHMRSCSSLGSPPVLGKSQLPTLVEKNKKSPIQALKRFIVEPSTGRI